MCCIFNFSKPQAITTAVPLRLTCEQNEQHKEKKKNKKKKGRKPAGLNTKLEARHSLRLHKVSQIPCKTCHVL